MTGGEGNDGGEGGSRGARGVAGSWDVGDGERGREAGARTLFPPRMKHATGLKTSKGERASSSWRGGTSHRSVVRPSEPIPPVWFVRSSCVITSSVRLEGLWRLL